MASERYADIECMTLTRYLMEEQKKHPDATGDLSRLINSIVTAVKAVASAVRKAGIHSVFGIPGKPTESQDEIKRLNELANELFINMIKSSFAVCLIVSEENKKAVEVEEEKQGKYIVYIDPVDGSNNIDCLVSVGSIFCIMKKSNTEPATEKDCLQCGRNIVAAGYALYGSATMMVLSVGSGVNGFMYDPAIGEFLLTENDMKIKHRGSIYSINEGYTKYWDDQVIQYVKNKKHPESGKPYSSRYIGSMVADVHRTLCYGGIFMYPATMEDPNGKLRLLYEVDPLAYIIEQAGGKACASTVDVLDIVPQDIHQQTPIFMGSRDDVNDLLKLYEIQPRIKFTTFSGIERKIKA